MSNDVTKDKFAEEFDKFDDYEGDEVNSFLPHPSITLPMRMRKLKHIKAEPHIIGYGGTKLNIFIRIRNNLSAESADKYTTSHRAIFKVLKNNTLEDTLPIYKDGNRLGKRKSRLVIEKMKTLDVSNYFVQYGGMGKIVAFKHVCVDGTFSQLAITIYKG